MKNKKLIIFLTVFLFIVSGCAFKTQKITVQKRISDENVFENYGEVTQRKQVKKAMEIMENADWEKAKVEMANFPHYRFQFIHDRNAKVASYLLWVSPNGENLEIVTESNRYVKLAKQDSTDLYEILVGESLK